MLTRTHYGFMLAAMNARDIIDTLGGPAKVSEATGININTVRNWYERKSIPARYHADLLRIEEGKVTAEQIVAAHAKAA